MYFTPTERAKLSIALRKLAVEGPADPYFGICYNLAKLLPEVGGRCYVFVSRSSVNWPGLEGTPRPQEDGTVGCCYPINRPDRSGGMWVGAQLDKRLDLIKHLRKELADEPEASL